MSADLIAQVALDVPLRRTFDYVVPMVDPPPAGARVRVPFGRGKRIGLVLGIARASAIAPEKLRAIDAVLDHGPLLPPAILDLIHWAAGYYQHPIGEVVAAALPPRLREMRALRAPAVLAWRATEAALALDLTALARRAPQQAALLAAALRHGGLLDHHRLAAFEFDTRAVLRRLLARGWVTPAAPAPSPDAPATPDAEAQRAGHALLAAQQGAVDSVVAALGGFQTFLLDGVTGSGKTEVYVQAARSARARGTQTLVLVPEIGLTNQIVTRFAAEFAAARLAVLHSGLPPAERHQGWLAARSGSVDVVIGTRSAVWTPLARPGLIIVDEEHDLAYKQQEGMRYNARDLAVWRGQRERVPIVLGSATPALESLHNVAIGRYRSVRLDQRIGAARLPRVQIVDIRGQQLEAGMAPAVLNAIDRHLDRGGQALLFLNRRGYAPVAICSGCGHAPRCTRCDTHYVYHRSAAQLRCHHCGAVRPYQPGCAQCAQPLVAVGQGTERVEERLRARFPRHPVLRIDRDTMRAPAALAATLDAARSGAARILVGTQMLSKGHDFPNVSLVAVIDTDGRLYSPDFRAQERLAQLLVQVSGRAGRAHRPGEVLIQSMVPEHPLLANLFVRGYAGCAHDLLAERKEAGLPPYRAFALLRAQAKHEQRALALLERARDLAVATRSPGVRMLGPIPAPMPLRAGDRRAQLLFEASARTALGAVLATVLPALEREPQARWVRWSIDVDPQEML